MELPPPPPPDENAITKRDSDLKIYFANLTHDHVEIEKLFTSVAEQLATMPRIGGNHKLAKEWQGLSREHRDLYRDSRENARACAEFLEKYASCLMPLTESGQVTAEQQRSVIAKFMEKIPEHRALAQRIYNDFHDVKYQVEVFPARITAVLKQDSGWVQATWDGVGWLFASICSGLQTLFKAINEAFETMFSHVASMRYSCSPTIGHMIEIEFSAPRPYQGRNFGPPSKPPHGAALALALLDFCNSGPVLKPPHRSALAALPPRCSSPSSTSTTHDVKVECKEIGKRLEGFIGAWDAIDTEYHKLLLRVEHADGLLSMPDTYSAYPASPQIQQAYHPLVQRLNEYADRHSLPSTT